MILKLIIAFAILLISLYLGIALQQDPGYVLIVFQHWSVESSIWVAMLMMIMGFCLLLISLSLLNKFIHIPEHWRAWRSTRRLSRAQTKTKLGLIEFSEGRWLKAKQHLIAAANHSDQPLVNYLTAAKAAENLGDHPLRDYYLNLAQTKSPDARIAITLTRAQLQIDNQEWEEADKTLSALQLITPDHPYVLHLAVKLYQGSHNWTALIAILPKLKPSPTLPNKTILAIKKQAYLSLVQASLVQTTVNLDLNQILSNLPKDLKHDPDITRVYAKFLLSHQQETEAEQYLRNSLKHAVHDELVLTYAQIQGKCANLSFIESLIKKNPNSASLQLCLGQLLLKRQLWGSARSHVEKSLQLQASRQAYYLLGQLLEALNKKVEACRAYRTGLEIPETHETK